ncbi:MAG: hypothetical protein IKX36_09295 [Prevotella sp.]|nr:hypothetical protein [Prevotella sp.]
MKRKLTSRQVTWLGGFIGLLITGGIVGLWSTIRHINNEEIKEKQEKDSIRISQKERIAEEVAAEQALQDSIEVYQNTHSPQVIAHRMQVILADEMRHEGKRPYYDKYRTESFKEAWHEADEFDKEPREEKPGMRFYDMPFYQLIPAKMIRDLEISRVYYVTNDRARADVDYLVKRTIKLEEEERDSTYYEHKTAVYKLVYQDNDWYVDDRMIDYQSERDCFKRYMEGEFFIDPIVEEVSDSLSIDSLLNRNGFYTPVERKTDNKPKSDAKKQEEKQKSDVKKEDNKQKSDNKKQDNKQKSDNKKQDNKQKSDNKKQDNKQKSDNKKQDNKQKSDNKKKTDTKSNSTKR